MKMWKLIAVIMAIIFVGGAIVTLFGRNDDSDSGLSVDLKKPEKCVYNISTGTVSAADDPDGKGYEYFACEECGEMRRIVANHESGHYFRTLSNGEKMCACGAILNSTDGGGLKNDFTAGTTTHPIALSWLSDAFISNGKWAIHKTCSQEGKQAALYASNNETIAKMFQGKYGESNVTGIDISFKLMYEGTFNRSGVFMNWQYGAGSVNAPFYQLYLVNEDGEFGVCYEQSSFYQRYVLTSGVEYTFDFHIDYETLQATMTVQGADLEKSVIFEKVATRQMLDEFRMMGISRYEFFCSETSDGSYKLYMDDLTIGCQVESINTEQVNEENLCDHDFTVKGIIDYDHPASEAWKKYTCKDCGCWYYGH